MKIMGITRGEKEKSVLTKFLKYEMLATLGNAGKQPRTPRPEKRDFCRASPPLLPRGAKGE